MDDYDAFDYVNGDFDKVVKGSNNNKDTSKTFPPKHKGIIYSYPSLNKMKKNIWKTSRRTG